MTGPLAVKRGIPERMKRPADYVHGIQCPRCSGGTAVIDSRPFDNTIRRRRVCFQCERRFTTYEFVTGVNPTSIGKDLQSIRDLLRQQAIEVRKFAERLEQMSSSEIDDL
jgi:transcriptional regulator NrdR family protein